MQNWLNKIKNIPLWAQAVGAGLLLGASVVFPYAGVLVFLGIFVCLHALLNSTSLKQAVFFGWLAFLMKSLIALSFLLTVYPVTSFPIASIWYEISLVVWSWFMPALSLSFGGVVLGGSVYLVKEKFKAKFILAIAVPLIWLASELAGSLGYSVITLGASSTIQTYFSMGYVGYALAGIPGYIGLSILYGVYGLSLMAVLPVVLWLYTENLFQKKVVIAVALLLGVIGFGISNNISVSANSGTILTIDTFFEADSARSEEKARQRAKVLAEAIAKTSEYKPEYIILPEDSRYLDSLSGYENIRQAYELYKFLNSGSEVNIIDTGRVAGELDTDPSVLRSYIFSATHTPVMSDKKYLTPQGEYFPYLTAVLVRATGNGKVLDHPSLTNYRTGDLVTPKRYDGPLVLFCFESIKPTAVRELMQTHEVKPAFVAHPISHAWFHWSFLHTHQFDTMLRIQAVWNGTTIISAGNYAGGKTYLPNGVVGTNVELARGEGWIIRESVR